MSFQKGIRDHPGIFLVQSKQPLIKLGLDGQSGFIAQLEHGGKTSVEHSVPSRSHKPSAESPKRSPAHPQSIVQKTVVTNSASEEIPVCAPYSQGSTRFAAINSSTANRRTTSSGGPQPLNAASASANGNAVAVRTPA